MAEINPYAPVVIDESTTNDGPVDERIFFGGTLTEADCQTVLLDQVPTGNAFTAWLRFGILALLLASVQWLVGISAALLPVLWIVGAMVISPAWMRLVGKYWHRGARTRYADALYKNAKPTSGWCDQNGLVKFDETSAIKATWQHFDRAFFFEGAINLLVQADARLRVVLPWHFFASADQFAAARSLVATKLPDAGGKQGQHMLAVSPRFSFDGYPRAFDPGHVERWSAQEWPFPSTPESQVEFMLATSRAINSLAARLKVFGMAVVFLFSFGFPFFAGFGGYVLLKYWVTGGWDFLRSDWFFHVIILTPVVLFFGVLGTAIVRRTRSMLEAQRRCVFLRLRDEGIYLRREGIEVWVNRDEIVSVEVDDEAAGWSTPADVDPVRIPKQVFADEEQFLAFGEQLSRYQPAEPESSSATEPTALQS